MVFIKRERWGFSCGHNWLMDGGYVAHLGWGGPHPERRANSSRYYRHAVVVELKPWRSWFRCRYTQIYQHRDRPETGVTICGWNHPVTVDWW